MKDGGGGSPIKGDEPEQLYDVIPTGQLLRDERVLERECACVRPWPLHALACVRLQQYARHAQVIMVEGV